MRSEWEHRVSRQRELEIENARLRDLVKTKIDRCDVAACDGCPLNDQGACRYDEVAEGLGVVAERDAGTPFPLMPL